MRSVSRASGILPTALVMCMCLTAALSFPATTAAQLRPEVSPTAPQDRGPINPSGALWRAAVIPGWGQVYNRQFIKVPFLYAALGGLTYLVIDLNSDYLLYRRAFLYKSFQELVDSGQLTSNPNEDLKPYYDRLVASFGTISSSPIRSRRNNLRRNRDLSVVGIGLVYGLSILDAYISAHLLDFDVGEDLAISIQPAPLGVETALSIRF